MAKPGIESFFNMSMGVGRIFGIPIKLHVTLLFFVWPAFRLAPRMGVGPAVIIVVAIIVSVLLHELGHALAAKAYKLTGLSITLHGFGGFAISHGFRTPTQALVITIMGPVVNFVLFGTGLVMGIAGLAMYDRGSPGYQTTELILYIAIFNLIMGVVNLIPMLPFDGGQIVAAILARRLPEVSAQRRVAHIGLILGPLTVLVGLLSGESMLTIFGIIGAMTSYAVLSASGGVRFFEFIDDRKHRKEVEDEKRRQSTGDRKN